MNPKLKISLILFPLLFIVLSFLKFSGNLNAETGLIVVFLSALTGLVVNRFNTKIKNTK
jgi:hypothetical protein